MSKVALKTILISAAFILISACGGGDSNTTNNDGRTQIPPAVTVPDVVSDIAPLKQENGLSLFGSQTISQGDSAGLALIADDTEIESIQWTQLSGPTLTILANQSQTIGFETPEVGDYVLQANARVNNNTVAFTYEFTVSNLVQANANIRLDHTVAERASVSLRVDSDQDIDTASIEWQQLAGPEAQNIEAQGSRLFFDAPAVERDRVLQFRATLTFANGITQQDDVFITINNTNINDEGYFASNRQVVSTDMFVFNQASPYRDTLASCVYSNSITSTCSFNTLPLIGQTSSSPTIDDILDKTLVSHQWMGERFKQYLEQSSAGEDMLKLLRGVTAVVISYDVRPSFYWAATGAIYLDADNFWVTPSERDTLNEAPDFRADFGNELNFLIPWRYVKNNDYYPVGRYPIVQRATRSFEDLEADISWLMYHELGHANDFFPPNSWNSFAASSNPLTEFIQNGTNSDILLNNFPLRSDEMHALARVRFEGLEATEIQRSYTGDDLITFFEPDISPSFYSYFNEREDYATLFERFMMKYRLNASSDVALITRNDNPEFIVSWGQRDRFNLESVQDRVRFAVERVLPELGSVASIQQQLPAPILMDPSKSWFDNIALSRTPSSVNTTDVATDGSSKNIRQPRIFRKNELNGIHSYQMTLPNQSPTSGN